MEVPSATDYGQNQHNFVPNLFLNQKNFIKEKKTHKIIQK